MTLDWRQWPADLSPHWREAETRLLSPGSPFELTENAGSGLATFRNIAPNLGALLAQAQTFAERSYIIYDDGAHHAELTFGDLYDRARRFAGWLQSEHGLQPGDRVAILGANTIEWVVAFWGTIAGGGIAVALNAWWTAAEIAAALERTAPRLTLVDAKRRERLPDSAAAAPLDESLLDTIRNTEPVASPHQAAPDDTAAILFTSGTTGRARGVMQTHRNMTTLVMCNFFHGARMALAGALAAGVDQPPAPEPAAVLVTSPMFHVSGLHNAVLTVLAGGATAILPGSRFRPAHVASLIERYRIKSWGYTETLLRRLLEAPDIDKHDLSSLAVIGGGGSPIPAALQDKARTTIPSAAATFGVGYGQTECGSLATLNPGPELAAHPDSVGRPVPTVQIEIRDETGKPVEDGVEGEIWVRSPMVMPGYWNDPEETAAVLSEDGWLRTGDWGAIRGGRLYIASRKRDLILRGGENVYPAEIEARLLEHPQVAEAAVVGVDSAEFGQEVKAVIVLAPGQQPDVDALRDWCAETLAYFKVPTHWEIRNEPLPRNAVGKVLKHEL
ncbi:MAG: long-chain fatty acid--CoA ligase [Candidatus Dadabacteria bacterium]|nr:MAG: long-chain fatty acid--CoA ligase [Candidatus Dadabacteria bacterium]